MPLAFSNPVESGRKAFGSASVTKCTRNRINCLRFCSTCLFPVKFLAAVHLYLWLDLITTSASGRERKKDCFVPLYCAGYVQRPRLFLRASRLISHARGSETSSLAPPLHGVCAMGVRAASPVAIVSRAPPAAQGMTGAKSALHANVPSALHCYPRFVSISFILWGKKCRAGPQRAC